MEVILDGGLDDILAQLVRQAESQALGEA